MVKRIIVVLVMLAVIIIIIILVQQVLLQPMLIKSVEVPLEIKLQRSSRIHQR
jgi:hypothetical protein